jgi:hypothetical protein
VIHGRDVNAARSLAAAIAALATRAVEELAALEARRRERGYAFRMVQGVLDVAGQRVDPDRLLQAWQARNSGVPSHVARPWQFLLADTHACHGSGLAATRCVGLQTVC